jgi:hypothetical protein
MREDFGMKRSLQKKPGKTRHPDSEEVLLLLSEALAAAREAKMDRWQFALELSVFMQGAIDFTALRELLCDRAIEHGIETTKLAARKRTFSRLRSLAIPPGSCFVLCDQTPISMSTTNSAEVPVWDANARTLTYRNEIIKRFRVPAKSQERVLAAFQSQGWPEYIENPLNIDAKGSKHGLHNTINSLNRHRQCAAIQFVGNGNGTHIGWIATRNPPI